MREAFLKCLAFQYFPAVGSDTARLARVAFHLEMNERKISIWLYPGCTTIELSAVSGTSRIETAYWWGKLISSARRECSEPLTIQYLHPAPRWPLAPSQAKSWWILDDPRHSYAWSVLSVSDKRTDTPSGECIYKRAVKTRAVIVVVVCGRNKELQTVINLTNLVWVCVCDKF